MEKIVGKRCFLPDSLHKEEVIMYCSNLRVFEKVKVNRNTELEVYLKSEKIRHSMEELTNIDNKYTYYTVYFKNFVDCTKIKRRKYRFESYEIIGNAIRFKVCDNRRARKCFMKLIMKFENGIRRFEFI